MKLQDIIENYQDPILINKLEEYIEENIPQFTRLYIDHPVKDTTGSISLCEAFWLWSMAKDLNLPYIIESGSLYGWSLYFLRMACPNAKIISFDPLNRKDNGWIPQCYKFDNVEYWNDILNLGVHPHYNYNCLAFFDDHIDQNYRLQIAFNLKIKHTIFHDNYCNTKQSHLPIRFDVPKVVDFMYIFDRIRNYKIFNKEPNNYRWLTYVRLK